MGVGGKERREKQKRNFELQQYKLQMQQAQ
jgi:hypothetical protein